MPQKKHIYIDLNLLLKPATKEGANTFEFNNAVIDILNTLKSDNRKAQFHILFNDNHVYQTPKPPYKNVPLCLFQGKPTFNFSTTFEILVRLKREYPRLFHTKNKKKTPGYFYTEDFEKMRLGEDCALVSNETFLQRFIDTPLHPVPIEASSPPKTGPLLPRQLTPRIEPFSLNLAAFNTAKKRMLDGEKNKSIHLVFDFDNTMILLEECLKQKKTVLNRLLVKDIIDLLNNMDNIDNVVCSVLSARPDDRPETTVKITDTLTIFISAVNEGIKQKHPKGISFKNIYCLQQSEKLNLSELSELNQLQRSQSLQESQKLKLIALKQKMHLGKMIVLASKKDNPHIILTRKFTSANDTEASFVDMLPPNDNDPSSYKFTTIKLRWDSKTNKSIFLKNYFIPEMEKRAPDFMVTLFDDDMIQIDAICALQNERVMAVPITYSLPALSQNRYALTRNLSAAAECADEKKDESIIPVCKDNILVPIFAPPISF